MNTTITPPAENAPKNGSGKPLIWVIILIIIALIVVALATGKNDDMDGGASFTDEHLVDENASDEVEAIEADLEADIDADLEQLNADIEAIESL